MLRTPSHRLFAAAALATVLAACSGGSENGGGAPGEDGAGVAPDGPEPAVIEERHENFEAIGDAFKAIRGQLEGGAPDFGVIAASATDINTRAKLIEGHFPEGTGRDQGYDTEALPTIWEKPEQFAAASQKLIDESATLMTLAEGGDAAAVGEQVKAMGGACKNCHDTFRLDDD